MVQGKHESKKEGGGVTQIEEILICSYSVAFFFCCVCVCVIFGLFRSPSIAIAIIYGMTSFHYLNVSEYN